MDKTYLFVPEYAREEAKELGARFDEDAQAFFVPEGADASAFEQWKVQSFVYLVFGTTTCWKCRKEIESVAIGVPYSDELMPFSEEDADDGLYPHFDASAYNAVALVPRVSCLPAEIRAYLEERCCYTKMVSEAGDAVQLSNRCPHCGIVQNDRPLFTEPNGLFLPLSEKKIERLTFVKVPVPAVYGGLRDWARMDEKMFAYAEANHSFLDLGVVESVFI